MKIYFACSVTGGRDYERHYKKITDHLLAQGYEVPTAHLAESNILELEKVTAAEDVYARDIDWLIASDCLIAEISVASHGVGYEIGFALQAEKPVLCLYDAKRSVSKMLTGNPDSNLTIAAYHEIEEAIHKIDNFVKIITSKI